MLERIHNADGLTAWVARRNVALSPRQLGQAFIALAAMSLGVGVLCALHGAPLVLPWSFVECAALAAAFVWWARHATDCERIGLEPTLLWVEVCDGASVTRHEFNPQWVQLLVEEKGLRRRVALRAAGRELAIGRHLDDAARAALARELRVALANLSRP